MPLLDPQLIFRVDREQLDKARGRIVQLERINDAAHAYIGQILDELHRTKAELKILIDEKEDMNLVYDYDRDLIPRKGCD